jgi:hypothetical protein
VEQKSAALAQFHREAIELKAKAEKELAEAKELQAELIKKEEELQSGEHPLSSRPLSSLSPLFSPSPSLSISLYLSPSPSPYLSLALSSPFTLVLTRSYKNEN